MSVFILENVKNKLVRAIIKYLNRHKAINERQELTGKRKNDVIFIDEFYALTHFINEVDIKVTDSIVWYHSLGRCRLLFFLAHQ